MIAALLVLLLWPTSVTATSEWAGTIGGRAVTCETTAQVGYGNPYVMVGDMLHCRGGRWRGMFVKVTMVDPSGTLHVEGDLCRVGGKPRKHGGPRRPVTRLRRCCAFTLDTVVRMDPAPRWPVDSFWFPGELDEVVGAAACWRHPRPITIDLGRR